MSINRLDIPSVTEADNTAANSDQPLARASALAREALGAWRSADPDHAIAACDHALELLLPVGPSNALADVLRWKGSILRDRGSHSAASDLYAQSLAVADAISYKEGRAHALNCLGTIAQVRGDLPAAERWYGEAARLAKRLGDRRLSGMVQQNLGIVADMQGRVDESVAHFRLALAAFELEDDQDAVLWVLNNLGLLYTREGSYVRAAEVLERALDLARLRRDMASEAIVEENRAALFLGTNRLDDAETAAMHAFAIAEQRNDVTRRAAALQLLARVSRRKEPASPYAITLLERALGLCEFGEDAELRVEVLTDLGDACWGCGERVRAKEWWRRALEVARRAGFAAMIAGLQDRLRPPASRTSGQSEAITS